jgi:hypothetical protein
LPKLALVAKGRATSELLDSYHDERHPIGAAVIRVTTLLTNVMTGSGPEVGLRDLVPFLVEHCQPIRHLEAAELAELTIDYRHSPLSTNHGHRPASAARPVSTPRTRKDCGARTARMSPSRTCSPDPACWSSPSPMTPAP